MISSHQTASRQARLAGVNLYLICDSRPCVSPLEKFVEEAILGGAGMIQLREKNLTDSELLGAALRCTQVCKRHDTLFIVNDRLDIALAAGADGVHLGQDDLAVESARAIAGSDFLIGLSTHSAEQVDRAAATSADYIGVGPIHATPTKPGRPEVGVPLIRYAAQHARQPFFAIGGLEPANLHAVLEAGAERVSVLRWITQSQDPKNAARAVVDQIRNKIHARQAR